MIDAKILPLQRWLLQAPARGLARWVTADQVSGLGFALGALTVPALAFGQFGLALVLLVLKPTDIPKILYSVVVPDSVHVIGFAGRELAVVPEPNKAVGLIQLSIDIH